MDDHPILKQELNANILREQMRLSVQQLPMMQITTFIAALILCWSVRTIIPFSNIITWLILVLSVVAGRVVLFVEFRKVRQEAFDGELWKNAYLLLALFSGVIWGTSAFLIFPRHDYGRMLFFALVIANMASTTSISHVAFKWGAAAWSVPAMILYAIRYFLEGGETATTIGFLVVLYLVIILYYSNKHHRSLTSSIALKFENLDLLEEVRRTNEVLRQASTIDSLTKLANRYTFDEIIAREWRRAIRDQKPLSLIMLDIDHFKAYNDTYGHQAGDDCLRKVASSIAEAVKRPADLAARYGGEEFVIVLPDTDIQGAEDMAEKLRRDVELLSIPHEQSSNEGIVTISVGVATALPVRDAASSDLLRRVDLALYDAKHKGRNRVSVG
ncbi:MAG TPA: diguanylate cyclase [Nitrospirota bacterium]|nr:diguanylate cyclase [Nitrospirota bacterium]